MNINFKKWILPFMLAVGLFSFAFLMKACMPATAREFQSKLDTILTDLQKRLPENGLKGLTVASGMKVQTMATEPTLINPTNIEVDERGRIWVNEAYNYRFQINSNKAKAEGDRIMILEDKDGDGITETSKVFYQGPEMNAPLGICVIGSGVGTRVIISQSPYVWVLYDDNGDDKADRKEILFQGIGGDQHDHGMHTFTSGPDGKLYFNFGNEGRTLRDKNNNVVLDQDGDEITTKKYRDGMLFRSDPDGSNVEVLGHNFRNPYEIAVDSYGTLWQSDNDDDGNKGTRINYVMENGNFGFKDEMTGATWRVGRVNLEDSIPIRHWHLNDPGVVPNLLQTGQGSPTGMVIYEGSMLPQQFRNQMIHAEPGKNVVRSYPVTKNGAGYSAGIVNLLNGDKDQWFRPADICVAPDGSLIVADWYDPGVGGHRVGDLQKGRVYRLSADGSPYKTPVQDYATPAGAVIALQNPNLAVRRRAFAALTGMGDKAIPELEKLWRSSPNPRMQARALWVLSKSTKAKKYLAEASKNANPDLRITGLRAARQVKINVLGYVKQVLKDSDPQVRREASIALRHNKEPEAAKLWATLAAQNDGSDRWYLEAMGIGADRQWDTFFAAYLNEVKDPLKNAGTRDIVWRARTSAALPYLAKLASEKSVPMKSRLRYFRAFDFYPGPEKTQTILALLGGGSGDPELSTMALRLMDPKEAANSPIAMAAIKEVLQSSGGSQEYLNLIRQYSIKSEGAKLEAMVIAKGADPVGVDAARLLFETAESKRLRDIVTARDMTKAPNIIAALGIVGNTEAIDILMSVVNSESYSTDLKQKAIENIGRSRVGETRVMDMLRNKKVPDNLIPAAVAGLSGSRNQATYKEALTFLPGAKKAEAEKNFPTMEELLALNGNALRGKAVYAKSCFVCHQVNNEGLDFGPKLSEIGAKYPKEGLLDAILRPSAGINFGYETSQLDMKDGSSLLAIISSRTETDIELKYPGGAIQKIKTADVKTIKELPESMMPKGLHETMTKQELSDLLEYLSTLKKK